MRELAAKADLAVHCAFVEVEGMSITEAMQQAVVPVIASATYSGTDTYALDSRSKFPAGDAKALAERIDYWFDHPQERWEMGFKYAESMQQYDIAGCAKTLIEMFQKAIDNNRYETFILSAPVPDPTDTTINSQSRRTYKRTA